MFFKCSDKQEAKTLFKKLAMRLHPDHGGDHQLMILLKETYEKFIEDLDRYERFTKLVEESENKKNEKKESPKKSEDKYQKVFEDVYDEEQLKIIDEIIKYGEKHERFDTSFTESIKEYLEENGFITSTQYNSLVRVYYSFRMDKKAESDANSN